MTHLIKDGRHVELTTLQTLYSTTKCHLFVLHTSERLRRTFPLLPLIAFRHLRNLRDLLAWATLTSTSHELPGNRPCGAARCKTCPILLATDEFSSHTTGEIFKMTSCKSSSVIYLVTCRRCGHITGSTTIDLTSRIGRVMNLMWWSTSTVMHTRRQTWSLW